MNAWWFSAEVGSGTRMEGTPNRVQFRYAARPGSGDDQISCTIRIGDVLDERLHTHPTLPRGGGENRLLIMQDPDCQSTWRSFATSCSRASPTARLIPAAPGSHPSRRGSAVLGSRPNRLRASARPIRSNPGRVGFPTISRSRPPTRGTALHRPERSDETPWKELGLLSREGCSVLAKPGDNPKSTPRCRQGR